MAANTVTVRLRGSAIPQTDGALALQYQGKKKLRRVVLPWIPDELERSGFARAWEQVPRPGQDPLAYDTGGNLRTFTFTVRVNSPDLDTSVEDILDELADIAETGKVVDANLGPRILGKCVISGLTIREQTEWTTAGMPLDATAEMELTEDSAAPAAVGPVPRVAGKGKHMARRARR